MSTQSWEKNSFFLILTHITFMIKRMQMKILGKSRAENKRLLDFHAAVTPDLYCTEYITWQMYRLFISMEYNVKVTRNANNDEF